MLTLPNNLPNSVPEPGGDKNDPEQTHFLLHGAGQTRPDLESTHFTLATQKAGTFPAYIGRFRIVAEIARGGMGAILSGIEPDLNREVVIKVLLAEHQNKIEYRQRFIHEARITGRLQHPGIVPVYAMGELADGRPYFVMRMVGGQTLEALLAARKDPTEDRPRFLQIFDRVCQSLAYAHGNRVIHRDLKPLNVMVAPFGIVKVMDWGVAKVLTEHEADNPPELPITNLCDPADMTQFGSVMGTPAYMAPEQALGDTTRVDRRTDVFGLRGVLCAILTGKAPYPGTETRLVHARASHADLAETFARLDASRSPPELVALTKKCLSPSQTDRPQDAGAVAAALTEYIESELRRAERDLVRFFELSPDLFCLAGVDGYFRRVNENFSRVLGYTVEELLSRPYIAFVHPEDHASTIAETVKLSHGLPTVQFRNRYRDVHGNYRWFEWAAKSIPEEGIVFAVARDITDWVELEARVRDSSMSGEGSPQEE